MKILFILPSVLAGNSSIIFELTNKLIDIGYDVDIATIDDVVEINFPLKIIPKQIYDFADHYEAFDAIIGFYPVCAYYVNDICKNIDKYYLITDDLLNVYTKEMFKSKFKNMDDKLIDIELEKQIMYVEKSYKLPLIKLTTDENFAKKYKSKLISFEDISMLDNILKNKNARSNKTK